MSAGTPHRTVRINDELWNAAKVASKQRGDNLSDVIRKALESYLKDATEPHE